MPRLASLWEEGAHRFADFPEFCRVFLPGRRAPRASEWFRNPELADSIASIAETRGAAFYRGAIARRIAHAARSAGAALELADLGEHEATWVEPLGLDFHGTRVCELPPNGQGLAALIALGVLRSRARRSLARRPRRAAPADRSDEARLRGLPPTRRGSRAHAHFDRRAALGCPPRRARGEDPARPRRAAWAAEIAGSRHGLRGDRGSKGAHGVADPIELPGLRLRRGRARDGDQLTQPGLGLPRSCEPERGLERARPYHTIMPGFLLRDGQAAMSFGVMGGHMQPQGHAARLTHRPRAPESPSCLRRAPLVRERNGRGRARA